ncbi:MAG: fibronectin type III domain-containing protein [Prevotella sp.]|nr:fibronectin type III domain-containing protein [Prevotella sp.]
MKRKSLLFALLVALFMPWAANAQESIPYTEGFESMSSASDLTAAGWISYQTHNGSFLAIETTASNVHSGSQALNIDSWNAGSTSDFVVVGLPLVDAAINTLQITFSYKVSTGNVYVGYLTDANDASTFVSLESYIASSSYTTVTKELNEAPATAARIAIKYLNWYRCYVDDIEVKALPTCVKPTLGNAQYITEEGASFQWTENGSATNWVLEYSTDQNFTNATSINRSGIPSYAITGLTAGTTYYVRVKSSCGDGDESDWSNVVTFTTLCESINAEGYSENFDEYEVASNYTAPSARVLPDCWSAINTTSYSNYSVFPTIYYYSSTNYANSTPNSLKLYSYYSSYSDYDPQPQYAILPPMNSLAGMQVTLQARGYNTSSTFKIGTMSDPSDASTFTMITEQTGLTTSYQEFEYVIPANCHDNFLAIMIDAASSSRTYNGAYIDDIVITEAPACTKPFGLAVVSASTTSATLSWTASGNETAWQICLDGDETNLIDANSNPFTIEGLTAATSYTAKVRANCGDEDYSDWSNTVTIETLCDVVTITESWSENFNSLTAGIPNCWDNSEGTTTNASYMWSYYATGHNGAGLRFNSYSNSNGNTNFLKTPTLNFATGKVMQLRFWYKNPTGGDFSVFISTDGGSTYTTALATGLTGVSSWTQQEINLTNYVDAENVVIVFKGTSNYGSGDAYIYLDDVAIVEAPSCLNPTELAVTANGLTATLTWESEVGEYEVAHATEATANPDENIAGTATEETYTMNNLALVDHYFWVRANCGSDGYSEWVGPVSVHIGYCVPNPTSHDGSGITGVSFGMGDYVVENGGEGTSIPASAPYYGDYSNMIGAVQAGVESTIAITTGTGSYPYTFVIWVDFDNSLSFEDSEVVYVGKASTGAGTLNATITVPATQATGDYRMRIYGADSYFNSFYGNGTTNWEADHDPCSSGTYRHANDYTLRVLEAPSCMMPTDLAVNYTGGTEASISWTSDAEAWNMRVNGVDVNGVITNPYTLTGLELATTYSVEVQANCGEDGTSEWTNAVSFTTDLCMPENQCEISYSFYDQYDDSWNGAYMNIVDATTEEVLYELTMPEVDGPYEGSFNVCDGRDIQFVWVSGSYPNECGYEFTHNGETILEKGTGETAPEAGVVLTYTVDCGFASYTLEIEGVGEENWNNENNSGYYLIASPVNVDLTNHEMTTGDFDLYYFDQVGDEDGNEWMNYKNESFNLEPGKGYLYAHKIGGEFTLTGTAYDGDGTIELVYDDNATDFQGWNLVGNPWGEKAYPDHAFYTMAEGGAGIDVTPNVAGTEVAPMTGIFVVAEAANETVTFSTEAPANTDGKIALNLTNSSKLVDRAIVRFGEGRQLPKFQLNPNHTKVYFQQEGKDYAIVNASEMGEMPVSFKAESNGTYTLSFNAEEVSFAYLHLIDNMTGAETDLLANPSYSFEAKSTDYANRFKLVFATGNNNGEDFAFFSNGSFVINNEGMATVQVIDVNGRILSSESINGCANVSVNAAAGVYMIRLVNGENVKVQKVVVR